MVVTQHSISNILALIDCKWFGHWQEQISDFILYNNSSIIQAPRQTGKTFILAIICVAYILAGKNLIIAYPTLGQAKRLLFREIKRQIKLIRRFYPKGCMKTDVDTNTEVVWSNGASILALSLDTSAQKEGYTADLLIIDEAHRSTNEVLSLCLPYLTQAKLRGDDKLVFLGIGGHIQSLIETEKEHHPSLKVLPSTIIEQDSRYEAVFKEFEKQLPPQEYAQHILLEAVHEGLQRLFPSIPLLSAEENNEIIDKMTKLGGGRYFFGIDVGEKHDDTIVTVIRHYNNYYDLVDTFVTKGSFIDQTGGQEKDIAEFIKQYPHRGENITIETNFNSMLFQSLQTHHFYDMNGVQLTYKSKKSLSDSLINLVKSGQFRVLDPEHKKDLEGLQFDIKVNGTWQWSHSDLFSSLLMTMGSTQKAILF